MSIFHSVHFYQTIAQLQNLPQAKVEVAFVGRSNAGKSTLINTLCKQTRLAYVSKTPGRTQHLNYFHLPDQNKIPTRFLVDLPGYGYAKAPEEVRQNWNHLLSPYLEHRMVLKAVVLVMDCRHPFAALDCAFLKWYCPKGLVRIVLNKADKLSRNQQQQTYQHAQKLLNSIVGEKNRAAYSIQLFSGLKKQGVAELSDFLSSILDVWIFSTVNV